MNRASPAVARSPGLSSIPQGPIPGPFPDPSQSPDDAAVIRRSRQDPDQFAVLFQRHAAAIGRYAARRLGAEAAEDIVASTFLAAFSQRATYDLTRQDARPWLYGIAGNMIRRHYRDEVRMLRALARTGLDPVAESFADLADDRLTAAATSRAVAAAVAALTSEQRDVLLLVAWAGLTYDQVAQALEVPEGTVRSRLNRARARLRTALGGLSPSEEL
jgi:RNA polymerase sigma factor (sigma-70 family)